MIKQAMSFREALVDTMRYYMEDTGRRSRLGKECPYFHVDGKRCAIGRFVRPEQEHIFKKFDTKHENDIEAVVQAYRSNALNEGRDISETEAISELLTMTDATLHDVHLLQIIHDEDSLWNANGLTEYGRETLAYFYPDMARELLQIA